MENFGLDQLKVGAPVIYVDPVAVPIPALVTAVWGPKETAPVINVVFVSTDPDRQDSYGRQLERQTSLTHRSKTNVHGQYYMMPGDTPNPVVRPQEA